MDDVVITAGARTPFGKLGGALAAMSAIDLGGAVIREVVKRSRAPQERVAARFVRSQPRWGEPGVRAHEPLEKAEQGLQRTDGSGLEISRRPARR